MGRRTESLSRARIVEAAVALLDDGGIDALTFRALAAGLATGPGAIYHHVANKNQLLSVATSDLLSAAISDGGPDETPGPGVHGVMSRVFDAIAEHPWLGAHLASAPWQPAVLHLLDRIGSELTALGVPPAHQFDAASVLVFHVLGVAGQHDAVMRLAGPAAGRVAFITGAAAEAGDPASGPHPFLERIGSHLAHHDDKEQFDAGVRIIMAGIAAVSGLPTEQTAPDARPDGPSR